MNVSRSPAFKCPDCAGRLEWAGHDVPLEKTIWECSSCGQRIVEAGEAS